MTNTKRNYDDQPKTDMEEDILNRKELVNTLSELIKTTDLSNSVCIGICGKWGSGKTTVINFVKNQIKKDVLCIDFNPWTYSSQTDISSQFLNLLAYNLSSKRKQWLYRHSHFFSILYDYIDSIIGHGFGNLFRSFISLLNDDVSGIPIADAKNKISKRLREHTRIAIFIDDLDRLDPEEIRMIMKLVRSVADFPNTIYILCYDDEIIRGALKTDVYKGHDYLQKIVNMEIKLPEYNQKIVVNELKKEFMRVTGKEGLNDYENTLMYKFLYVPLSVRDLKVVLSRFHILYDISHNNTCPIDLLSLTIIQTKSPETYDWISYNRYLLCGLRVPSTDELMNKVEKKYPVDFYREDQQDSSFEDIISILFPHFKQNYYRNETEMIYMIRESQYIDHYFRLAPSSLDFSDETIESFINTDSDSFLKLLNGCDINYISNLTNRSCNKMKIVDYRHQSEELSNLCLMQPFCDTTFNIRCVPIIVEIVKTHLYYLDDQNEKLAYLRSSMPNDNIHKIIIYGALLERIISAFDEKQYESEIKTIYEEIVKRIMLNDVIDINDPIEIMMSVILVSRVSEDSAKSLFLKIVPLPEARNNLYKTLIDNHYDIGSLIKLAGDDPSLYRHLNYNY